LQRRDCTPQHDTCNLQRRDCTPQHDTCNLQRRDCTPQHDTCNLQGPDCTPQHDTCNGRGRDSSCWRNGRRRHWPASLAQLPRLLPDGEPPRSRGMGFNYNVTDGVIEVPRMKQPPPPRAVAASSGKSCGGTTVSTCSAAPPVGACERLRRDRPCGPAGAKGDAPASQRATALRPDLSA
jgi:hypothetical protein